MMVEAVFFGPSSILRGSLVHVLRACLQTLSARHRNAHGIAPLAEDLVALEVDGAVFPEDGGAGGGAGFVRVVGLGVNIQEHPSAVAPVHFNADAGKTTLLPLNLHLPARHNHGLDGGLGGGGVRFRDFRAFEAEDVAIRHGVVGMAFDAIGEGADEAKAVREGDDGDGRGALGGLRGEGEGGRRGQRPLRDALAVGDIVAEAGVALGLGADGVQHGEGPVIPEAEVVQAVQLGGDDAVFGGQRAGEVVVEVGEEGLAVGFLDGEVGFFSHFCGELRVGELRVGSLGSQDAILSGRERF